MSNQPEIKLASREDCTGCAACAAVCPWGVLRMEPDEEGFSRPVIGKGCLHCRQCQRVCPALAEGAPFPQPRVYALWNKNGAAREKSTSGGFFPLLAEHVLAQNGVVYGAAFDDAFRLLHISVTSREELPRLQGAKYVQSDTAAVYPEVKARLLEGRPVLFSGTPCQVEGLHRFLDAPYGNLITCDLICHGVPSPSVWQAHQKQMETAQKSPLRAVSFRDKRDGWSRARFTAEFRNGNILSAPLMETPFGRGFGMALFLRPSCHRCRYGAAGRRADFTLGDFWGLPQKALPSGVRLEDGVSLVLVHTGRGRALFSQLKDGFGAAERSLEEAARGNPRLLGPLPEPPGRAAFFRDFQALSWGETEQKWLSLPSLPYRIAAKLLSPRIKTFLRSLAGGGR